MKDGHYVLAVDLLRRFGSFFGSKRRFSVKVAPTAAQERLPGVTTQKEQNLSALLPPPSGV